jgi:hypothetical protein
VPFRRKWGIKRSKRRSNTGVPITSVFNNNLPTILANREPSYDRSRFCFISS